ncbi:MAG TPA: AAA-like domain-containing protein [Gammaproteobacteria bacterium]|nr:AAA-like domain-containing protein [Gammaproteobacteria bacterium]
MPKVIQAAEFFVVGGPVQPDRLCYVEREADRRCAAALAAHRHCWVLGPRAIGKSSLMARAARVQRQAGGLTALVDLAQLDARGQSADANLWSYGIAHKIAHELKLKADLATWWREKNALSRERRLADFFWEILLTDTTAPVTVFIDDIEQTIGLPFAAELFAALQDCDVRRNAETDFKRLTFVLLGVASLRQLLPDELDVPFAAAETIELGDFTPEESYQLALGFGGEEALAQALMDRVCVWTNGHPYLTQKVARGAARKRGKLEDVERVVREQLLVPTAMQDEPPVQHARALLTATTPAARQARKALRRVARGAKVAPPRDPAVLDVLRLSGVAGVAPDGALRYRNRIFKELLGARWLKTVTPNGLGRWAAAAAIFAVAALGVYWYTQYLPRPYIRTLTDPGADRAAVEDAYRRLHALPGFALRAETLLGGTLRERSGTATTLAAALATDARLRQLPGEEARADALLAEFWLRRAELATHAEQRDAALLFALRAAAADKNGRAAPALVAELVADDYRGLDRTVSVPQPPIYWSFDWPRTALLSIDSERRISRRSFAAAAGEQAPVTITALQHSPLSREIEVDDDGSAGPFELTVAVRHPASNELQLTIAAPNGATATVRAPLGAADQTEELVFSAAEGSTLAALADENRRGVWRLTVVDRRSGNAGSLTGWKLLFGDDAGWRDEPDFPVAIPDPVRTEAVTVTAAKGFAIAAPIDPGAVGAVALWNLVEGRLQDDFTLPTVPQRVELNAMATRLLAVAGNSVSLWNVADGLQVARLATQTEFVLPPIFSVDGGYLAIAERVEGDAPLFSLLSAIDGALLASVGGVEGAQSWLLGPGARYLALLGPQDRVRVFDPRRGVELAALQHAREVRRLLPVADGASLLTIDSAGDIRAWSLGSNASAGRVLGTTADPASASLSADGRDLAYTAASGEIVVLDVATGALLHDLRLPRASPATGTQLSVDGATLVTGSGSRFRLWTLADAGVPPRADARAELGALALDREADVVAVGSRSGQLRVRTGADLAADTALDYFGHRGAVTSMDVAAAGGIAASGGADGTVRVWDLATGGSIGAPLTTATDGGSAANAGRDLRPTATDGGSAAGRDLPLGAQPVDVVAVSPDGRSVAAAAGAVVQVWRASDGASGPRLDLGGGVVGALAFAPNGELLAAGDAAGAVRLTPLAGGPVRAAQAGAAVGALAFGPHGDLLASGDAAGVVRLWRASDAAAVGAAPRLSAPIRWLGFDSTGAKLYVATDYWVHGFEVRDGALAIVGSRLPALRFATGAHIGAATGERVRLVGLGARGALASLVVDATTTSETQPVADTFGRDWVAALGLRIDDAGEAVADGQ